MEMNLHAFCIRLRGCFPPRETLRRFIGGKMTWPTRVDGMRKFLGLFLGGVILFFLFAQSAPADNVYATIRGTVTDASGAVLPGVQVTATNTSTGISTSTTTQDTGAYEFLQLPIASYTISATKQGFKTFKSTSVTLVVNQAYNLPIGLEEGVVSRPGEIQDGWAQSGNNN